MTESGAPPQADLDVLKDQGIAALLITGCNAALRVFRIHEDQNAAVDQPISTVRSAVLELFERHDQVVLAFVEGVFYFPCPPDLTAHKTSHSNTQFQPFSSIMLSIHINTLLGDGFQ